ncbi:MAG: sulfate ABC transporter ATP-binding protein [Firmicutes bacterium]|nr:sulfate ABC transporter ATP-binding protein [Bacillota bacterium]
MSIEIINVRKKFGPFTALDGVSLQIPSGELMALLGPSGCGKTTLLRIIAGLEVLDEGKIIFHGEDQTFNNPRDRQVGFVFQHYALFRHLNVFENVAFGLRVQPRKTRLSRAQINAKVSQLLNLVQMEKLAYHYPAQLSGGQRQRVALARALAVEPKVLLLDEPFGALDAKVRKELRRWLRRLHDQIHLTSIFVTHDQEEALEVAGRIVVMNEGRVEQVGTPEEVYDHPKNAFVYKFLGNVNLLPMKPEGEYARFGNALFRLPPKFNPAGPTVTGYIRPHEMEVTRQPSGPSAIEAAIHYIQAVGPILNLELKVAGVDDLIIVEASKETHRSQDWKIGEKAYITVKNLAFF